MESVVQSVAFCVQIPSPFVEVRPCYSTSTVTAEQFSAVGVLLEDEYTLIFLPVSSWRL